MKKLMPLLVAFLVALTLPISCNSATTPSEAGFLLNVTAGPGGTVQSEVNGTYSPREQIEITAYPDHGFSFYRWVVYSADSSGPWLFKNQNPARFAIQWNLDIVATFKETSELFFLSIVDGPHGGIPAGGASIYSGNYLAGEVIAGLIVRPNPGWSFERWVIFSRDFEIMGTIEHGVDTFVMPSYDVILVAEYKEAS
ncbi:MAG: hypothetical protein FWF18_00115 [Dehalococcoidia bacterium]|nr:hypothetical protein [Dehalococcoidia bacterium]